MMAAVVYVTWGDLSQNLLKLPDKAALIEVLEKNDPAAKPRRLPNHASQIWPFAHTI